MNIKNIILSIFVLFLCLGNAFAQTEKKDESVKKVVIVKKIVDADGNETVEETVLEGKDAAEFELEEMNLGEEKRIIKIEKEEVDGQKTEKKVRIMKFDSDEDELTPEMIAKLKEEGINIEEIIKDATGENIKIKTKTEDAEVIDITGEDKIIFIDKGEKEMDVEKEIIIVDKNGKEQKTQMRIKRKMMDSNDGNTLNIKSLNINLDGQTLTVNAELSQEDTKFCVMDTDGKVIYKEELKKFSGELDRIVNLEKAANGPLFMVIKQGDQVFSERIVR